MEAINRKGESNNLLYNVHQLQSTSWHRVDAICWIIVRRCWQSLFNRTVGEYLLHRFFLSTAPDNAKVGKPSTKSRDRKQERISLRCVYKRGFSVAWWSRWIHVIMMTWADVPRLAYISATGLRNFNINLVKIRDQNLISATQMLTAASKPTMRFTLTHKVPRK